ncbi:MAG TPA: AIR synthase family protein [Candidatus Omnitrophota bacterium]|nr:AIR synthase family protein [Candidatus Omnitrophota bacterium]
MNDEKLPELGKIHPEFFDSVIYPRLGAKDNSILIGPTHGIDYGVIKLGETCLSFSTDPFFIVPAYGFARAAWFAFHIIMSDVAVSGLLPRYLTVDLNLPPSITEAELSEMWGAVDREARKYGVSIITGHTARYAGCNYPMVGGATSIATGTNAELRGPHRVKRGDLVVITKGPAVETTGLLAISFPGKFESAFGKEFQKKAEDIFFQMSVMDDCAIARRFKGVHAMHDATECGIWGGLFEMARAGNYGLRIEKERVVKQDVIVKTCEHFGIDPFTSISEGTLLAMVAAEEAEELVEEFKRNGILSSIAGEVVDRRDGIKIKENGRSTELDHPKIDPYWGLMEKLSKEI